MACFRFKKFSVTQDRSAMRVNTDGVLLGAWMNILPTDSMLLDIGTGSGVIALMAAQRIIDRQNKSPYGAGAGVEKEILGIDIDAGSVEDASENFEQFVKNYMSEVGGCNLKIKSHLLPLQDLPQLMPDKKYDLIFSNPPYFINALKSADGAKSNARHTDMLSQGEIIHAALQILAPEGRLALILPFAEAEEFVRKTEFLANRAKKDERALRLSRLCKVHTLKTKPPKRCLIEFVLSDKVIPSVETTQLIIESNGEYTAEYKAITGDFYLNF